jgi:hypothetical protein
MGLRGCVDHTSITLDRPGKSLRRLLPLQSRQGYLGLRVVWVILTSSTLPIRSIITGFFPTRPTVVGILDPCLFFFFLSIGLLASEISLSKEDEREEDLACEEGKEDLTGEEGEGST